ncbi:COG3650 family protein [Brevundimonas aurantiaca]|jgi:uncharacterized membrane protein|uniref:Putative membrane protein n=1 Tax=Brevundimonas aurantiaca TaxID=74316 RepID=A0A7W9C6T1_9CAUL|nr:hypothetical protein [Brevundimonas aurantiaca]MBB5740153.1 putative membrane protein [Brevundimonas aurantiaca]
MRPIAPALTAAALTLSLTLVGGCYDRKDQTPEAAPPPEPAPVLAGVDLGKPVRALGTEPFWSVEITPDGLTYTRVDQPAQHAPNRGATVQGTVATYATSTDLNEALNVVLIATECSDGMSDRTYPLTAKVEIGDDTLTGCAASVAALATRDEAG